MKTAKTKFKTIILIAALIPVLCQAQARPISPQIKLSASLDKPIIRSGQSQTVYLQVGLTGFEMPSGDRAPVNTAVVLDKSGSMSGEKIEKAKQAAVMAVERLQPQDIISFVVYDTAVNIIVPATKASNRTYIINRINSISAGGSTALYAGVRSGSQEMKKFLSDNMVNRLILLSDGIANVGPSSPSELARLGKELVAEGISVSTIGLGNGYNEDLMSQLAMASDGAHYFARNSSQLRDIFNKELGRAMAVVAQEININIHLSTKVRPVRILNFPGNIKDNTIELYMNQLFACHERYIIVELEVPAMTDDSRLNLAYVTVDYDNLITSSRDKIKRNIPVSFTSDQALAEKSINRDVTVNVIEQLAVERNEMATSLRDAGNIEKAKEVLMENASYLKSNAAKYESAELKDYAAENEQQARQVENDWTVGRKAMRESQTSRKSRQ